MGSGKLADCRAPVVPSGPQSDEAYHVRFGVRGCALLGRGRLGAAQGHTGPGAATGCDGRAAAIGGAKAAVQRALRKV